MRQPMLSPAECFAAAPHRTLRAAVGPVTLASLAQVRRFVEGREGREYTEDEIVAYAINFAALAIGALCPRGGKAGGQ